ncbi:MAG: hypothetical protein EHM35_07255 [Planctomycetaceae bacterium]|nr:MAG: hypothetical protein EHM35_07255 [Planctomycetaceae bacterium]
MTTPLNPVAGLDVCRQALGAIVLRAGWKNTTVAELYNIAHEALELPHFLLLAAPAATPVVRPAREVAEEFWRNTPAHEPEEDHIDRLTAMLEADRKARP